MRKKRLTVFPLPIILSHKFLTPQDDLELLFHTRSGEDPPSRRRLKKEHTLHVSVQEANLKRSRRYLAPGAPACLGFFVPGSLS
jgi:hypothetical protein